jgi:hypothetical protein
MSLFAALALSAVLQQPVQTASAQPAIDPAANKLFHCAAGGSLLVQMVTSDSNLIAVVDAGEGPKFLPLKPWLKGDPPQIVWTDGQRTLTWNPGVKLMWMDGAQHRDCGRDQAHLH